MKFHGRKTALACLLALSVFACSDDGSSDSAGKSAEHLSRADSYFQQGQYKAATIEIKNALQANENNLDAHILLANVYYQQGNHKLSVEVLNSLPSRGVESDLLLAKNYLEMGKANSVLTVLNDSPHAAALRNSTDANLIKVRALITSNNIEKAKSEIAALEPKLTAPSDFAQLELAKSSIYAKAGEDQMQLDALNKAIKLDENNVDARLMLARYYYQRDKLEAAEDQLSQALFSLPNTDGMTLKRLHILKSLVATLSKLGRSSEAMVYSQLIADANPKTQELEAEFQKVLDALKNNDIDGANEILEKLYSSNPNQIMGSLLGIIRYQQGDFQAAADLFDQSIDPETASSATLEVFAATELRLNRPDEALRAIELNIRDNSDNPKLLSLYGIALLFSGEKTKATEVMKAALELDPTMVRTSIALADAYNGSQQPKLALAQLEKAYKHSPADTMLQARLIQQYDVLELTSERSKLVEKLANSDSIESQSMAGLALLKTDPKKAQTVIDNAYQADPNSNYTINAKLMAAIQSRNSDSILEFSEKLLKLDENNILALRAAASAKEQISGSDSALQYLSDLSKKSINCWAADFLISQHYMNTYDYKSAIPPGEAALTRSSFNTATSNYMVKLYHAAATTELKAGNSDQSKQYVMDALQIAPNDPVSLHILVNAELIADNLNQAKKISKQVEEQASNPYISLLIKGDIENHEGKTEEAILHYLDAWNMRPNDSLAKTIWSNLSDQTSITRPQFLIAWEQKLPQSFEAATLKGIYYQQKGQPAKAVTSYKKSLELNPNQPVTLNNLAWIYFEKGDMANATKHSEQAYNLAPENPAVIDTYAWVMYKDGKIKEAKALIEKALKLAPDNKEIEAHFQEISSK